MKQAPLLTALFASLLLITASCNNKTKSALASGMMIPKEAAIVVHINNSSLSSKLSWKEIQATNWFKEFSLKQNDSVAKRILEDPDAAGIDTKADLVFFVQKLGTSGVTVLQGTTKDAAAFEKLNLYYLKEKDEEGKTEKVGDINYILLQDDALVSWKGSAFAYIMKTSIFDNNTYRYDDAESDDDENDDAENEDAENDDDENDNNRTEKPKFNDDSLKSFASNLYDLESSNSLSDDDRFSDLLKEDGDIHFWMDSEKYYSSMMGGMGSMMSMMKVSNLFNGNISTGTISFDDGKISMKGKQYMNEEVTKIMEKHKLKDVSADLINRIPSQNVIGAMAFNYPPEALRDILKLTGMDGGANAFLGKLGYSMDEFLAAYDGNMLLSVSDFSIKKELEAYDGSEMTFTKKTPDMKVLFAMSVKDKNSFQKLLDVATKQMKDDKDFQKNVKYTLGDDWFAAGNSQEYVDKFLAGGNNNIPFASKISGQPFGMYLDIQKMLLSAKDTSASMLGLFDASVKMWQDVVITGGDFKKGYYTSEMVVNLMDKKTNSLKQMNLYIDEMFKSQKKNKMEDVIMDDMRMDSSADAPPIELPKD